jgi:hypothetical protein
VAIIPFLEHGIIILAATEQCEFRGAGKFLVELQIAINRNLRGIDARRLSQITPDKDWRSAPFLERDPQPVPQIWRAHRLFRSPSPAGR